MIRWVDSCDSTNRVMRNHLDDWLNFDVLAAVEQVAGRGQRTHFWHSAHGLNLTFSLLLKPHGLLARDVAHISDTVANGISEFLHSYGIDAWIKPPNDIWVGDRKICGILIENVIVDGGVAASIVGVGLNVNETDWPMDLPNPVSMKELCGKEFNVVKVLSALVGFMEERMIKALDSHCK